MDCELKTLARNLLTASAAAPTREMAIAYLDSATRIVELGMRRAGKPAPPVPPLVTAWRKTLDLLLRAEAGVPQDDQMASA